MLYYIYYLFSYHVVWYGNLTLADISRSDICVSVASNTMKVNKQV